MFGRRHDTTLTETRTDDTVVEDGRPVEDRVDDTTTAPVVTGAPAPARESATRVEQVQTRPALDYDVPLFVEEERVHTRTAPGQLLAMGLGIFFAVLGALTLVRGGLGGSLYDPVVEVLGFARTPLVGVIELGAGVLFIVAGVTAYGRPLALLLSAAALVAGILVIVEPGRIPDEFGVDRDDGWLLAIVGGAALIGFVLLPFVSVVRRRIMPAS